MFHKDAGKFSFDYENNASFSYLVVKTDADIGIINYQIEMLANNPTSSILAMETRQVNDKLKLYYNITSLSSLAHYLKRKKLNKMEFVVIIRGIIRAIADSGRLLLEENCFIMDEDYIFINPGNLEVALAYVPIKAEEDINSSFKSFIHGLIMNTANFDENSGDNFIARTLSFLREDGFLLNSFDRYLLQLVVDKQNEDASEPERKPEPEEANVAPPLTMAEAVSNPALRSKSRDKKEESLTVMRRVYKRNSIIIALLVQLLLLIAIGLSFQLLKSMSMEDKISTAGGILIILAAVDFLALRKLLDKRNMVEIEVFQRQGVNMTKREIIKKTPDNHIDKSEGLYANLHGENWRKDDYTEYDGYSGIRKSEKGLDTVVIGNGCSQGKSAYLKSINGDMVEKIPINKQNFIIGRLKDQVDYISQNNAVGKVHAELTLYEGKYYVKDLNSKNGTKLNGERISSNVQYEISNNDRIEFANSEYIFINS